MTGSTSRPPMSAPIATGPVRSNTSLPGQPPQSVGRPGVAKLQRTSARSSARRRSAMPQRREARLGRPIVLPSLTATARIAALPPESTAARPTSIGFDARTSPARLRPADAQVGAAAGRPLRRASDSRAGRWRCRSEVEVRPADVEQFAAAWTVHVGMDLPAPVRPERVARPPPKRTRSGRPASRRLRG